MFILTGSNSTYYLVRDGVYEIGNSSGDIKLNDSSISENHAEIILKSNDAFIVQRASLSITKVDEKKLSKNEKYKLDKDHKIQFGNVGFTFKFENKVNVCSTGLMKNLKNDLKRIIRKIDGVFVEEWKDECTHLTTNEIVITVKFLHALIDEKPIVLPEYWVEYYKAIKEKKPLPDFNSFSPPLGENIIHERYTKYNSKRINLFQNKTFLCFEENKLHEIIKKVGGKCVFINENMLGKDLSKLLSESIMLEPETTKPPREYSAIIKQYLKMNKRMIPIQEVVLAILQCSCKIHCNPECDKIEKVFKQEKVEIEKPKIIVPETETYEITQKPHVNMEEFIPATLDVKKEIENSKNIHDISEEIEMAPSKRRKIEVSANVKSEVSTNRESKKRKDCSDVRKLIINDVEAEFASPKKKFKESSSIKLNPFAQKNTKSTENNYLVEEINPFTCSPPKNKSLDFVISEPSTSGIVLKKEIGKNKKKKLFVEDDLDYSTIEHNITEGKIFHSLKNENQDDEMDEDNKDWYKQFKRSVKINESTDSNIQDGDRKNFKKFRKVPVIKSGIIIHCS